MRFGELYNGNSVFSDLEVTGLTCDSRQVVPGGVFVCITGAAEDGHKYAASANEKGAAVIVCERDLGLSNQLVVEDTKPVFADMCAAWFGHPADKLKIIGVTGTNGKTSVSYMLKAILETAGEKVGLIGTIQNLIGDEVLPAKNTTPGIYELSELFAKMADAGCTYAIMEVSSHALDQGRVCGIHFTAAMFTNLSQDHLDYHITMENYLLAKKKLFSMCDTAVVNIDDPAGLRMTEGEACQVVTYSAKDETADYFARNILLKPDGVSFEIIREGIIGRISLKTAGVFSVYNATCAAACANALGFSVNAVCSALSALHGVKGRAEIVPSGRDFTLVIDYAHTPDGLENILETFAELPKKRLVTVFGCGGDRDKTKRPQMGAIAAKYSDYVIVTSDNPRTEDPELIIKDILAGMQDTDTEYTVITNRIEAIKYAVKNATDGDIIIFAGKGHETYQILGREKIHLDEREVIAEALAEL